MKNKNQLYNREKLLRQELKKHYEGDSLELQELNYLEEFFRYCYDILNRKDGAISKTRDWNKFVELKWQGKKY